LALCSVGGQEGKSFYVLWFGRLQLKKYQLRQKWILTKLNNSLIKFGGQIDITTFLFIKLCVFVFFYQKPVLTFSPNIFLLCIRIINEI